MPLEYPDAEGWWWMQHPRYTGIIKSKGDGWIEIKGWNTSREEFEQMYLTTAPAQFLPVGPNPFTGKVW